MGLSLFAKCSTNYSRGITSAPNPDPKRWELLESYSYAFAYVLVVRYLDATNFEGVKVMLYKGRMPRKFTRLDPHFTGDNSSPVARFRPDEWGLKTAKRLAEDMQPEKEGK